MNKADWPTLEKELKAGEGFLTDREIAGAINKGQLISDAADLANAKYACYEVRIGPHIQQLVMDQTPGDENDLYREKNIPEDGVFRIKPSETFKIYAAEQLYIPADVFAITIPVGNMYKLGLNPETTFADPGFAGRFYVTVCNYSPRVVRLRVGDPLARVFFFKLSSRPDRIHDSRPRELPPSIERVHRPDLTELMSKGEKAVLEGVLDLVDPPHFEHVFVTGRIFSHHQENTRSELLKLQRDTARATLITLLSFFLVTLLAIVYIASLVQSHWPSFFGNIFANFVTALVLWAATVFFIAPLRRQFFGSIATLKGPSPNQ